MLLAGAGQAERRPQSRRCWVSIKSLGTVARAVDARPPLARLGTSSGRRLAAPGCPQQQGHSGLRLEHAAALELSRAGQACEPGCPAGRRPAAPGATVTTAPGTAGEGQSFHSPRAPPTRPGCAPVTGSQDDPKVQSSGVQGAQLPRARPLEHHPRNQRVKAATSWAREAVSFLPRAAVHPLSRGL